MLSAPARFKSYFITKYHTSNADAITSKHVYFQPHVQFEVAKSSANVAPALESNMLPTFSFGPLEYTLVNI
jgi:hypothetical protein